MLIPEVCKDEETRACGFIWENFFVEAFHNLNLCTSQFPGGILRLKTM